MFGEWVVVDGDLIGGREIVIVEEKSVINRKIGVLVQNGKFLAKNTGDNIWFHLHNTHL